MCLARVKILDSKQGESEVLNDVARIEPTGKGLAITDLVGRTRTIEGTLRDIDFVESIVLVQRKRN